ncbi:SseB family protein [Kocuria tytonicola]|uniref:SseB family protein n=1 Tax=Kocuria tytonicola TaxID=2055946 RepID=A0A3L9L2S3_9MICC|nr:SseB family protein [Kocuria tytonicola]RLY92404.1 SseB family protein [Kocuria tytonicola]
MPEQDSSDHDAARALPPHIAAQLRSAGGPADTGGQAWEGRNLGEGTSHTHQFPEDDGAAAPALGRALTAWREGHAPEDEVVAALSGVRVFVPIIAQVSRSHITEDGLVSDKEADMALVSLQASDGRKALPVFTSTETLRAWNAQARPVAADIRRAALSAVQDGSSLLVLDPGADPAFVVRRPALWAVAQGRAWTPSYRDFTVDDAVTRAALGLPGVVSALAAPGSGVHAVRHDGTVLTGGGEGPELVVSLQLRPGLAQEDVAASVRQFQQALAAQPIMAENVDSIRVRLSS